MWQRIVTALAWALLSVAIDAASAGVPGVWSQHSFKGTPYWYNSLTGVSTWDDPHASVAMATTVQQEVAPQQAQLEPEIAVKETARATPAATSMRRPMRVSRRQTGTKDAKEEQSAASDSLDTSSVDRSASNTGPTLSTFPTTRPSSSSSVENVSPAFIESRNDAEGLGEPKNLMNTVEALNQEKDAAMDAQEKAQKEADDLSRTLEEMKIEVENRLYSLQKEHTSSALEMNRIESEKRGEIEDNLKSKLVELNEAKADIKGLEKELQTLQELAEAELRGLHGETDEGDDAGLLSLKGLLRTLKSWFVSSDESPSPQDGGESTGGAKVLEALAKSSASRIKGIKSRANGRYAKMKKEKDDVIASLRIRLKELGAAANLTESAISEKDGVIDEKDRAITELTEAMQEAEAKAVRNIVRYDEIKDNLMKMTTEQERLLLLLDTSNSESADLTVRLTILKGLAVKIGEERDSCALQRDHLAVYYSSLLESKEGEALKIREEVAIMRDQLQQALSTIDVLQQQQQPPPYERQDFFAAPPSASSGDSEGADYYLQQQQPQEPYSSSAPSASWENEYVVSNAPTDTNYSETNGDF